jgi:uracil-DNA glycosylase
MVRELDILHNVRVVVALGKIAFDGFLAAWRDSGLEIPKPKPKFGHGSVATLPGRAREVLLLGSYHPSQQNTFTGRLTAPMFYQVFRKARLTLDQ